MADKTRNQLAYCKRHIWGAQRVYLHFGQSRQRFHRKGSPYQGARRPDRSGPALRGGLAEPSRLLRKADITYD